MFSVPHKRREACSSGAVSPEAPYDAEMTLARFACSSGAVSPEAPLSRTAIAASGDTAPELQAKPPNYTARRQ
jgi:hypothetical protein